VGIGQKTGAEGMGNVRGRREAKGRGEKKESRVDFLFGESQKGVSSFGEK